MSDDLAAKNDRLYWDWVSSRYGKDFARKMIEQKITTMRKILKALEVE